MSRPNIVVIVVLSVYTAAMRFMPYALDAAGIEIDPLKFYYPWNFSPLTACCLFGAAYLSRTAWAYLLPVAILFISDLGIWAFSGHADWAFHRNMATVYGSYLLIAYLGGSLRQKRTMPRVWGLAISGQVLFFLITNFGTWALTSQYAHTTAGLLQCYELALPFFKNSLAGTLFFSTLIFGPFLYQERKANAVAPDRKTVAA